MLFSRWLSGLMVGIHEPIFINIFDLHMKKQTNKQKTTWMETQKL